MNLTTHSPALPARRHKLVRLSDLRKALDAQLQPPASYVLGLAPDGLPVIARIATTTSLLATSDDMTSRHNLLTTIARTINTPARTSAILASRWTDIWDGISPTVQLINPERLGPVLQRHLQSGSPNRMVVLLDNLGAGWSIEPRALRLLTQAPQFQVVATANPYPALRYHSLFDKILVGKINDFSTLFDLTAPTTLTTPPAIDQFAFRHQSRWLTFTPATP
jgi:hypothetical protein